MACRGSFAEQGRLAAISGGVLASVGGVALRISRGVKGSIDGQRVVSGAEMM